MATTTAAPVPGTGAWPSLPLSLLADIAAGLARTPDLADRRPEGGPGCRVAVRLLATDAYDAWAIWWPPTTSVTPHDHGDSVGAFRVVHGELTEVRWRGRRSSSRAVPAGATRLVPAGTVHDVVATGGTEALSVHVYSPPLREMGFYDDGGALVAVQPVDEHEVVR